MAAFTIYTIFIMKRVLTYFEIMELPIFFRQLSGASDQPSLEYAEQIFNRLETRKLKKNQTLLRSRTVPNELFFIKKGLVKISVENELGVTTVCSFHKENEMVGSVYGYLFQKRSDLILTCVEPTEVLCLNFQDFEFINQSHKDFKTSFYEYIFKIEHRKFIDKSLMISQDARARYESFINIHEAIIDRIPLKDVASYLGIKQQSLSRLRRDMG